MSDETASQKSAWTEAYSTLTPLFFRILRRLARQGYLLDSTQGMDVIHDFFLKAWPQVMRNYSCSKGTLAQYAAKAFMRFARTRLVKEARWAATLIAEPPEREEPPAQEDPLDVKRIRTALRKLPPEDRWLLERRFGSPPRSERALATGLGVSRYELRERAAAALARLAVGIGERGELDETHFRVARHLFAEEASIEGTAAALGVTEGRVRAARKRIVSLLGRTLAEIT